MRYHQAPLTDSELMALYKFTCCALYQSSEWSGSPEQAPRLVKLIQQLQQALAQDVLTVGTSPLGRDVMALSITLTITSSPPDNTAVLAQRIADDMAHLHHRLGDGVSDELGISISYLVEQFALLAAAYRSPEEKEKHP